MAFRRLSFAVLLAVLLTSCSGGNSTQRSSTSTGAAKASASPSAAPLTAATAYLRARQAESTYTALHGTVAFTQTTLQSHHIDLHGSFETDLQAFGGSSTSMSLLNRTNPPATLELRAIGSDIYDSLGGEPWVKISNPHPPQPEQLGMRELAGQMMSPLDPQSFTGLLAASHNLTQRPDGPGRSVFTGTAGLHDANTTMSRYNLLLPQYYSSQGITMVTFTVGLDDHARPTSVREQLHSANLTVDCQLTITGYAPATVTPPI